MGIHSVQETTAIDLTAGNEENIAAKEYAWTARIVANAMVHALVGGVDETPAATEDDYPVIEFKEALLNVGAGCELSLIVSTLDTEGTVWVSEIKVSS